MALSRLPLLLALFCALSLISADTVNPDMVVNVFRHGARGPIQDPLKMWGNYVGQLTPVGMRMHYLLGVALKDKYPNLLTNYDPAKIILRSTDYNRTIMSVYSQLFGIYGGTGPGFTGAHADILSVPPYADYDSNNTMRNLTNDAALPNKFQVLPFHVDSPTVNRLLKGGDTCPNYKIWSEQNIADEESVNLFKTELAEITQTLKDAGIIVNDMSDLAWIGDTAIAHKFQSLPIPGNVEPTSQGYLDLKFATEWNFFKAYGSGKNDPAIHSLYLLRGIQDYILSYLNGTSPANFVFLSGHDSTLMPVLIAFGITTKDCLLANYKAQKKGDDLPYPSCIYPGYASNIVFEVYGKTAETATIKFFYNNIAQPICGKTGDGSNTCSLKELNDYIDQVTKKYTFNDYNQICGIKAAETPIIYVSTFSTMNFLVGFACAILALGLVVTCNMAKKKDYILLKNSEKTASLLTNL